MDSNITTIKITRSTHSKLRDLSEKKNESFEKIISRIIDEYVRVKLKEYDDNGDDEDDEDNEEYQIAQVY